MEARSDVLERIAATNPLPSGAIVDAEAADRLYASIVAEPRQASRRRPSKRAVAAAFALALAAITAPALGFREDIRSFFGLPASPAVLEESRLLVAAPVADGTVARLWASPSKSGGECSFVTYGPPGEVEQAPEMGGGICSDGLGSRGGFPGELSISVGKRPLRPRGATQWVPPVVSGHLDPNLGAARVEVLWNGGSKELSYASNHFIGAVEALYEAPADLLPIRLIAYDADGREVHRRDLSAEAFRLD